MKITLLAGLFCITALLYASAGFGGGSSYTALLIISGTDYRLVPIIALATEQASHYCLATKQFSC